MNTEPASHYCVNQETNRERVLVIRIEGKTASISELTATGEGPKSKPIPLDEVTCNWCGKGLTPEAVSKLASKAS